MTILLRTSIVFLLVISFILFPNDSLGQDVSSLYFAHGINLSNNQGLSEAANIAVSGNNVYVVWQDNSTGNGDIYMRRSTDGGQVFQDILNLSNNTGSSQIPQIAVSGNNVYVVWQDNSRGKGDIYFRDSANNGDSFAKRRNLSNNTGSSQLPQIAVSGNNVYVVWQDNSTGNGDIYLRGSANNGDYFVKRRNLSNDSDISQLPHISVSGNNTQVVWIDHNGTNSSVFFKSGRLTQLGGLQKFTMGEANSPKVDAEDGKVFAVWESNLGHRKVIMFYPVSSLRQGSDAIVLSNVNGSSSNPGISTFGPNTFIVWQDQSTGGTDVYIKKISTEPFERNMKK